MIIATIQLNRAERFELHKVKPEDKDKGGFQSYMVQLQKRLHYGEGRLSLVDTDIERIQRYSRYCKGGGGYQGRLRKIFGRHLAHLIPALLRRDAGQQDLL